MKNLFIKKIFSILKIQRLYGPNISVSCMRGFTLVELLVSVGILVFVLMAVLGLFVEMLHLNNMSREMTLATSHAQHILEDIRSSSGVIINQIDNYEWDFDTDEKFAQKGLLRIKNEIIEVNYDDTQTPMPLTVSVTWEAQNSREYSLTFVTMDTGV